MNDFFTDTQIEEVVRFHGHRCPGLAIGIRAAELCLKELGHHNDSALVAICETDMCGVDAIQFFTGCSAGKGNLIFRDHGKMAFTFFRRADEKGFRALLNPEFMGEERTEMSRLMALGAEGRATPEQKAACEEMRSKCEHGYLDAELSEIFSISDPLISIPRPAKILQSLVCENCGEVHMESRSRRFAGQTLCIPCFEKVEQKI
ncbi:FmdE family protein [Maridesulfovibrio sp.]|uniref:FmdE family protein n=1 Tax=Maridesulfovibrio sp. TaxID=2795000 RepID=UPI002A189C36|nr:FmdE family protein [Maridesulfovibrio sp.]